MSQIDLFFASSSGTGRDNNDKSNKIREQILMNGFNGKTAEFCNDPEHGAKWRHVKDSFESSLRALGGEGSMNVIARGGRNYNYDFEVVRSDCTHKVEFKFGGNSVESLPEFFNPAANKAFHPELYADLFYTDHLPAIADLYGLTPPPKEDYMRHVYKNTSKHPFFVAFRAAESARPDLYSKKGKLVAASITAYLEKVKNETNLELLTEEFMRSQSGKHFLIWSNGEFHHDSISDAELTAKSVVGVRNGNILVIQSAEPKTRHEMLLRWKNHLGVLFPAWQISMRRAK
jgi:hypothetical protein